MSKTFKTAHADNKVLKVDVIFGNPCLLIKEYGGENKGFVFDTSDAPALALAVLEAAGVEGVYRGNYNAGSGWQLEHATGELSEYVMARAAQAAEAREQAELEAEALELCNEYIEELGYDRVNSWDGSVPSKKEAWLAVARRAQEMRNPDA